MSCENARKPENLPKNRYRDILPCKFVFNLNYILGRERICFCAFTKLLGVASCSKVVQCAYPFWPIDRNFNFFTVCWLSFEGLNNFSF